MVVEVGLEAHILRHPNHLVDIALAAFKKAIELGLFQPLRMVGKPREKVMIVVIDLIVGSFAERVGEVTVEIKILHLVAQVPEVKVSLQLRDGNETLRQLRMVIGVPRGTLGCGLLDQSVYLVPCFDRVLEISSISQLDRYSSSCIHKFVSLQES